jgi:hypothetical protein
MNNKKRKNKEEWVEIVEKAEINPDDPGYYTGDAPIIPGKKKKKEKSND